MGYPYAEVIHMSWSRIVLTLQAENDASEAAAKSAKDPKSSDEEIRYATQQDIAAWI